MHQVLRTNPKEANKYVFGALTALLLMIGHAGAVFRKDSIPFVQALVIFVHCTRDYFADIPGGRVCILRASELCRWDVGPLSACKAHVWASSCPHTWFSGVLSERILLPSRLSALRSSQGGRAALIVFLFCYLLRKCKHSLVHFIPKPVITKPFCIHQHAVYFKDFIEKLACEFNLVHVAQIVEDAGAGSV